MKTVMAVFVLSLAAFGQEATRIALVNTNVSSFVLASALSERCHEVLLTRNPAKAIGRPCLGGFPCLPRKERSGLLWPRFSAHTRILRFPIFVRAVA
jgi:hypothetical protein